MSLFNLVRVLSATTGTGTLTLGAAVSGCLTFALAGVPNGAVVSYGISDGVNSEVGRGTYDSAAGTLTRDTVLASTNSGNKINCSGNEQVFITILNKDLIRYVVVEVFTPTQSAAIGDGKKYIPIPPELNTKNLIYVHAFTPTPGTTGTMDIQIARDRAGTVVDMLSTKLTIDTTENGSETAAAAAVINASNDDVLTNDRIRIDVDAVQTTPAQGLLVTLGFGE